MTEILPFDYEGREVRTVTVDGQPWFVAADVCSILEIGRVHDAVRGLDDDERATDTIRTPGGDQQVSVINEPGLYSLVLRSRKPEAKQFKRWITHEVLPSIRRTGTYAVVPAQRAELPDITTPAGVLAMADMFAHTARQLVAATEKVAELAPAANSWNVLASGAGDYSVADAAKILARDPHIKIGQTRLFTVLRDVGWCFRQPIDQRHRPYQSAIETGRLSEIPQSHYHPRTGVLVVDPPQLRITVKGLQWLHRHLGGAAELALPESAERRAVTS